METSITPPMHNTESIISRGATDRESIDTMESKFDSLVKNSSASNPTAIFIGSETSMKGKEWKRVSTITKKEDENDFWASNLEKDVAKNSADVIAVEASFLNMARLGEIAPLFKVAASVLKDEGIIRVNIQVAKFKDSSKQERYSYLQSCIKQYGLKPLIVLEGAHEPVEKSKDKSTIQELTIFAQKTTALIP